MIKYFVLLCSRRKTTFDYLVLIFMYIIKKTNNFFFSLNVTFVGKLFIDWMRAALCILHKSVCTIKLNLHLWCDVEGKTWLLSQVQESNLAKPHWKQPLHAVCSLTVPKNFDKIRGHGPSYLLSDKLLQEP